MKSLLYGDAAIGDWPPVAAADAGEPWRLFIEARTAAEQGNARHASDLWLAIAREPDLEPRHVLQAWTFLRRAGLTPPDEESSRVLGVICEIAVSGGHDVLAAYADGSSRYINFSGRLAVGDPSVEAIKTRAETVVAAAEPLSRMVGVWEKPELPAIPAGHGRLLLLTPGGFRFGQGPQADLWQEPGAKQVLGAATQLMVALTAV